MRIIKHFLLLTPVLTVSLSTTACSLFGLENNLSFKILTEIERKTENNMQFLSQRTFSLKFYDGSNYMYGTGWIFAKDNDDKGTPDNYHDDTYYIATNLHVASAIQNRNQTSYVVNNNSATKTSYVNYNKIYFGVVSEDGQTSGTNYTLEDYTKTYYNSYIDISNYSSEDLIAYTTFDMFNKMNIYDLTQSYYKDVVENGTMDLAILKIDFSQLKAINNKTSNTLVEQNLDAYIKNPTTFNSSGYTTNESVTIAGFPYYKDSQTNQHGTKWSATYNVPPRQLTNNLNETTGYLATYANKANQAWLNGVSDNDKHSVDNIIDKYVLNGDISYKYNGYAGYRNIARQAMFYNVLLSSGASGSMAINENNEVVGIYWGTYKTSEGSIGTIDSFINNKVFSEKASFSLPDTKIEILKQYNVLNDFMDKVPNTNLKDNIK